MTANLCACRTTTPYTGSCSCSTVLVTVNGEPILKAEIDPVYEEYIESDITYEQIIEDTIDEILVIQQAPKYNCLYRKRTLTRALSFIKSHTLKCIK